MTESIDLLDQKSHFAFGQNWASYAKLLTQAEIDEAIAGLRRLAGSDMRGKRFLDIGCGSGLHSLAALRLGAGEVVALDIDPDSVATTRALLQANESGARWSTREMSVFDPNIGSLGRFDVVYSWGVLHHTGDMYRALRAAAELVAPGGQFIFALYRRTRMCGFWKLEKRWYSAARARSQARVRTVYVALYRLMFALTRRESFASYVSSYRKNRGMDFYHDVHDWLGGWPYESISPAQTDRYMQQLGLKQARAFVHSGTPVGLMGSGCDEYAYGKP